MVNEESKSWNGRHCVLEIPPMPTAAFYCMRKALGKPGLSGRWLVESGQQVAQYQAVMTFGTWSERTGWFSTKDWPLSLLAPMSGKVVYRADDGMLDADWDEKRLWPAKGTDPVSLSGTLFAIEIPSFVFFKVENMVSGTYRWITHYLETAMQRPKAARVEAVAELQEHRAAIWSAIGCLNSSEGGRMNSIAEWRERLQR